MASLMLGMVMVLCFSAKAVANDGLVNTWVPPPLAVVQKTQYQMMFARAADRQF
jgi:hypothetical protein